MRCHCDIQGSATRVTTTRAQTVLLQERRDVAAVRQAIVDCVAGLEGFSFPAKQKSDRDGAVEVHFHTGKLRYLDVIHVDIADDGATAHMLSTSSNLCPTIMPCALFRCCCACYQLFGDGGYNEHHIRALSDALQQRVAHDLEIVYSSRPK